MLHTYLRYLVYIFIKFSQDFKVRLEENILDIKSTDVQTA